MIYTTLNKIREHDPCTDSWEKLLGSLGKTKADDEQLSMVYILDTLGFDDCLWAARSLPEYDKEWRLLACDFTESVLHLYEDKYPDDNSVRNCINTARKFAMGNASNEELAAAGEAAGEAAVEAGEAAGEAAWEAAWATAWEAGVAARAARAAGATAGEAGATAGEAGVAAREAKQKEMEKMLLDVLESEGS